LENTQLQQVVEKIDQINDQDPNRDNDPELGTQASTKLYGMRMSAMLQSFYPQASDLVRIAARAQHIKRWEYPRSDYPQGRKGYMQWRTHLYEVHARITSELMQQCGYSKPQCAHVEKMLKKRGLKKDPDVQTLEDIICLVFIRYYLSSFMQQHEEEKIIDIIRKTAAKMSPYALACTQKLDLAQEVTEVLGKALG